MLKATRRYLSDKTVRVGIFAFGPSEVAPCSNGAGEVEYIVDNKYIWKNYLRSRRRRRQRGETKIDHSKQCGIKQNQ